MDDELRVARFACRQILAKLSTLGTAAASAPLDRRAIGGKATKGREGNIPRGTRLDAAPGDHPPSKDLSLHAHYVWRMERAASQSNTERLLMLAAMARRDYAEFKGTYEGHEETHVGTLEPSGRVQRLLAEWEGRPAAEVAGWERCPVAWVKQQRVLAGRDAETGEPSVQSDRVKAIVRMKKAGDSSRAIAAALNVSHPTVLRELGRVST